MISKLIKKWNKFLDDKRKKQLLREKKNNSCYFCEIEDDDLKLCYIWEHGHYGDYKTYYKFHVKCLETALDCPEICGTAKIDTAIKIIEMMDYWTKRKKEAKEKLRRGY